MATGYVYHPIYLEHNQPGHPEQRGGWSGSGAAAGVRGSGSAGAVGGPSSDGGDWRESTPRPTSPWSDGSLRGAGATWTPTRT